MTIESISRLLNVIGICLLITETFDLRDKVERFIDAVRQRALNFASKSNDLVQWGYNAVVMLSLVALGVAALVGTTPEGKVLATSVGEYAGLAIALVSALFLIPIALFAGWLVLWVLDRFPKGSLAGIGALSAISSLALDYV